MLGRPREGKALSLLVYALPALAVAVGGCSAPTTRATVGATLPRSSPLAETPATSPAQGYSVPATITSAYVQGVLDRLEGVTAQATALIVSTDDLPPQAIATLRAVNSSAFYGQQLAIWVQTLSSGTGNFLPSPGPVTDRLSRLISASRTCIFVMVTRDYSASEKGSPSPSTAYVVLRSSVPADDPGHLNPTPWVFDFIGYDNTGAPVADSCTSGP